MIGHACRLPSPKKQSTQIQPMKTKYTLLGATMALLGCMGSAHAVITVVEHQTFNDNATPATYTEVGTPSYAGGALVLNGSSGLTFTAGTPLTATDNFGIEAIVL